MSTSLLYHALGIRGYRYVRTDYFSGAIVFTIEQPRANLVIVHRMFGKRGAAAAAWN